MAFVLGTPSNDNDVTAPALRGTPQNDTFLESPGADLMFGGLGNDIYEIDQISIFSDVYLPTVFDTVIELPNEGTDTIKSSKLSLSLLSFRYGLNPSNIENIQLLGTLALVAVGDPLANRIEAHLNTAANQLTGGNGNDTYVVGAGDTIVETATGGRDRIEAFSIAISLANYANVEDIVLMGTAAINATGSAIGNLINGATNSAANTLAGLGGNDSYFIGSGDRIVEFANSGTDTVFSRLVNVSIAALANVENIALQGNLALTATGNNGANTIDGSGNIAANVLAGGNGNDTFIVGAGDTIIETATGGNDLAQSATSLNLSLYANVERGQLIGTFGGTLTGSARNDVLTGNAGSNMINGLAGSDVMAGGAGNDTYTVNVATDRVIEQANGGIDTIVSPLLGYFLQDNVENLTLTNPNGTGFAQVFGNALNNVINGTAGNDFSISGGFGNDTLNGNGGIDFLNGDAGEDKLFGGTGNDTLNGGEGGDRLAGGTGKDALIASNGADTLLGNENSDGFFFDAQVVGQDPFGRTHIIRDFSVAQGDEIYLKNYPDLLGFDDLQFTFDLVFDPEAVGGPAFTPSIQVTVVSYNGAPIVAVYMVDGALGASNFTFGF